MEERTVASGLAVATHHPEFPRLSIYGEQAVVGKVRLRMQPGQEIGRVGAVPVETVVEKIAAGILGRLVVNRGVPAHSRAVGVKLAAQAEKQVRVEGHVMARLGVSDRKLQDQTEAGGVRRRNLCPEGKREGDEHSSSEAHGDRVAVRFGVPE
jgi:hypothetical protein